MPDTKIQERNFNNNRPRKSRGKINIQFSRGLSSRDLNTLLQHELLRARSCTPTQEVRLPAEIVHELKFRLRYYSEMHGSISDKDRESFFADENYEDYPEDKAS